MKRHSVSLLQLNFFYVNLFSIHRPTWSSKFH